MPGLTGPAAEHPCFSGGAHRRFGRIHLPVAPRCNLQCAYCDRRYDCPNESRPGVTSSLLTPKDAVQRTALALARETGAQLGKLTIALEKEVPVCAGMAGGSSDAAAVLRCLNRALDLGLTGGELARIGATVGSDVPYCVLGGTALATGRGEEIAPLPPLPGCWVVLAKPDFPVSTPELFARLDTQRVRCHPDTVGMISALKGGDLPGVARRLFNVFEEVLPSRKRDRVEELKDLLLQQGALGASMSGTGPTVFGLFDDEERAKMAHQAAKTLCRDAFLCRSLP